MSEDSVSHCHIKSNLIADIIVAVCFVLAIGITSLWFESRKNRSSFYPNNWLLLAPLDADGGEKAARSTDLLISDGGEAKFIPKAGQIHLLQSGERLVWTEYTGTEGVVPFVNLDKIVGHQTTGVIGYAQTSVTASEDKEVQLGIAADDGIKIWINGEVIFDRGPSGAFKLDKDILLVKLKTGVNQVLVKNTQLDGGWGFALHFSDK